MQEWQFRVYLLKVDVSQMVGYVMVRDVALLASGHEYQNIGFEYVDLFSDDIKFFNLDPVDIVRCQAAAVSRAVGIADTDLADVVPQIFDLSAGYDVLQLRDKSFRSATDETVFFSLPHHREN